MNIPTLETQRLRLVAPELRHFQAYAAAVADAELMRALEHPPQDLNTADRSFCAMVGHWHLRGCGAWIVEEKTSGRLVARVGLLAWETWPEKELAWWVVRECWGQGYAPEAAQAVLDHVWSQGLKRLVSLIRPTNHASIRVAQKLGAVHEKDIAFMNGTSRVYVHQPR